MKKRILSMSDEVSEAGLRRRSDGVGKEAGEARGRQKMYKIIRLVTVFRIMSESTASYRDSYIVGRVNQCPSNTGNLYTDLIGYKTRPPIIIYHILHYDCHRCGWQGP